MAGYESHVLDTSRPIQYNRLTVNQEGDVSATIHRPLRQGKPWAFHGLEGISQASLEETNEQCVSYQLSKRIKIKGKDVPWTQQEISEMLIHVTEELYQDDEDINPYDGEALTKMASLQRLSRNYVEKLACLYILSGKTVKLKAIRRRSHNMKPYDYTSMEIICIRLTTLL